MNNHHCHHHKLIKQQHIKKEQLIRVLELLGTGKTDKISLSRLVDTQITNKMQSSTTIYLSPPTLFFQVNLG